jgi:hypothetical protein
MQRALQDTGVHCKIGCDTKSGPLNHASTQVEGTELVCRKEEEGTEQVRILSKD